MRLAGSTVHPGERTFPPLLAEQAASLLRAEVMHVGHLVAFEKLEVGCLDLPCPHTPSHALTSPYIPLQVRSLGWPLRFHIPPYTPCYPLAAPLLPPCYLLR